jgi:hypothetical protein
MQPSEAQIVIDRATKLFPKWGPTAEEIEQWISNLANLDFTASQQAVESVWRKTKRASMVYVEFITEYSAIFQRRQGNQQQAPAKDPYTGLWAFCTGKDEQGRGAPGRFMPVGIGIECEQGRLLDIATQDCQRYAKAYGGVWEVYQGTVWQMQLARHELQGIKPMPRMIDPERPSNIVQTPPHQSRQEQVQNFYAMPVTAIYVAGIDDGLDQ